MSFDNRKKFFLKTIFVVFLLGVVSVYGYFKTENMLEGPIVEIISPTDGATISTSTILLSGTAENISFLSLNDRGIYTDEEGRFSEAVALSRGYNILSIRGEDKFGKKTEKIMSLVFKE